MFLPSRRLYVALAASSVAIAFSPTAGFAGIALLILLWVTDGWLAGKLDGLAIDTRAPARMGQDQENELEIELENRTGRRLVVRVAVDLATELAGEGAWGVRTLRIPNRARATASFPLTAARRGNHAIERLALRVLGPLALAWKPRSHRIDAKVLVIPGLKEAREKRLLAWHHIPHLMGSRNVRERGDSGAFESLREYVRGDDPRRIDWKATARRRRPIVRRYEAERSQNLILCIDSGRWMAEEFHGRERLDHALSAAVVLADVARAWNDKIGAFVFADRIQRVLPPGHHPPDRIPTLAAEVESRSVEPDYPRALVTISRAISRRSLLVFFSDVIDETVSEPLTKHLALLARRHLPLFVAMRNPDLASGALAPAPDLEAAYNRAAASELVLARERTLSSMRQRGIQVLDVAPSMALESVINRYVEIKRRGIL